jgi:hypothetical protein
MPKTKKKAKSATGPSDYFPDIDKRPNNWVGTEERATNRDPACEEF